MPNAQSLRSRWVGIAPEVRDRSLAVVATVAGLIPALAVIGPQFGNLPRRDGDLVAVLLLLGQTLPLAIRVRWPGTGLIITWACFAVHEVFAYPPSIGSLALYFMLYSAGARVERYRRVVPAIATAGYVIFTVLLLLRGSPGGPLDFLLFYLVLVTFWLLGALVRGRRRHEAERRELTARAAAAEERARIARELHDVVTHHVTAMVVQADAARYLTSTPERVTDALGMITGSGREALTELRFLLGVLEATGARTPSLGTLRELVERTGREIELVEEGERRALPARTELTAYRIVQEALTNAAKYAAGSSAAVRVGYLEDRLEIEVTTDGRTTGPGELGSGGRGLTGLRDRVLVLGGEFAAGPSADGFRVSAMIPARSDG
jgi:signal transduction histidine kinase